MSACDQENKAIINWQLCVLCQTEKNQNLIKPRCSGYESLGKNIKEFHELGQLPYTLNDFLLASLNDLKNVLSQNQAVWHKSCFLKINNTELQRAQERVSKNIKASTNESHPVAHETESNIDSCLFCNLPNTNTQALSTVISQTCNDTIIECAQILEDRNILEKVSENRDLISLKVQYHNKCLTEYKNKRRAVERKYSYSNLKKQALNTTFAKLIEHINKTRDDSEKNPTFSIADLAELQKKIMKDMGFEHSVQKTTLKQQLLAECPYLTSFEKKGMTSLIAFKDDVDLSIRSTESTDERGILLKAAEFVRAELFDSTNRDTSVPASVLDLVTMIVFGPHSCADDNDNRVCLFLAELLSYHVIKYKKRGNVQRHDVSKETSAPVYLAAKLFAETRKKSIINCTYSLGMSISYQRLQNILTEKANSVCELYHREGVVCPPKMQKGIFTTAAVDNIDHNPASPTAKTSFHGTAITLMQHKMGNEICIPRDTSTLLTNDQSSTPKKRLEQLPTHYSIVPPCFVDLRNYTCTRSDNCTIESNPAATLQEELEWLDSTMTEQFKPWAAHHAAKDCDANKRHRTEVSLLPLFTEQSHSHAMMVHSMDVVIKAIKFLNPEQVPILVADQPLYALLKQLQFTVPEKYGEDKIFIMMGGLHIEMAALKVIGQWLKGSGWVETLVEAKVTTQGRSESMLQATNVSRTRYAYQVTAAALYALMRKAYLSDCEENESLKTFDQWRQDKSDHIPQFKFWDTALNLIIAVLRFVRSIRNGDFSMYLSSIRNILPWFFALDHVNYARWLSVHLKDLVNVTTNHPELLKNFMAGQFVARKSNRKFSGMALDQAHEQMNAILKGDGGMIGLTENPDALLKWLLSGPQLADMVCSFEQEVLYFNTENSATDEDMNHHSDTAANAKNFIRDVKALEATLNDLGNPFLEQTLDLYNVDTKMIAQPEVVEVLFKIEKSGDEQYITFCKERLNTNSEKKLQDTIKQNRFPLFSSCKKNNDNKTKTKIGGLKNDCSLFSKLYIATCEHRAGDLDSFFAHENHACPPALSSMGKLRSGTKSDLLKSIIGICDTATVQNAPQVSAKILDGPALVHMLNPAQTRTFGEYADKVFLPFLCNELNKDTVERVDVVWDTYQAGSLKNTTREKRGSGQRTRVTAGTKLPKGWSNFLKVDTNKEELFHLLSTIGHSHNFENGKEVCFTDGEAILTNVTRETQHLSPCNHEEADSRMMVHVSDAVTQGHKKIMLRTVDTDVVVLAVAQIQKLPELKELWVHIGTGKHHQYVGCHNIANTLGPQRTRVLPLFHALTGCDTVSSFNGKGKKSAFEACEAFPDLTEGLQFAYEGRINDAMAIVEKYVVILYDRSSKCSTINECRKYLFTKKDRQLEYIPPTKAALYQHFLRAVFQGVHVWDQMKPIQNLPCPSNWGWTKSDENWQPMWTDLPIAAEACMEIIRCKCKKQCSTRCSCLKRHLKCTHLCLCNGTCYKNI